MKIKKREKSQSDSSFFVSQSINSKGGLIHSIFGKFLSHSQEMDRDNLNGTIKALANSTDNIPPNASVKESSEKVVSNNEDIKKKTSFTLREKKKIEQSSMISNPTGNFLFNTLRSNISIGKQTKSKNINLKISVGFHRKLYIETTTETTVQELKKLIAKYLDINVEYFALAMHRIEKDKSSYKFLLPYDAKIKKYLPVSMYNQEIDVPKIHPIGIHPAEYELEIVLVKFFNNFSADEIKNASDGMKELISAHVFSNMSNELIKTDDNLSKLAKDSAFLLKIFIGDYDPMIHAGFPISYMHFIPNDQDYNLFFNELKTMHSKLNDIDKDEIFTSTINEYISNDVFYLVQLFPGRKLLYNKDPLDIIYCVLSIFDSKIEILTLPKKMNARLKTEFEITFKDIIKIDAVKGNLIIKTNRDEWKINFNPQQLSYFIYPILLKQMCMQSFNHNEFEKLNLIVAKKSSFYRFILNINGELQILNSKPRNALFENHLPRTKSKPRESHLIWRDSSIN